MPQPPGASASDAEVAALVSRRERIRLWWRGTGVWKNADDPSPPIGLALSGGGIRSATFSLGLLQGLAKAPRDALSRIDLLSTVSGGGYAGCFFRSLFVPTALRSIGGRSPEDAVPLADRIADQYRLARTALGSNPDAREVSWRPRDAADPVWLRNPMWWLREHSRYLAPTGPSDYGFAVAYIARNWLAMVYLFVLACVAIAAPVVMIEGGVVDPAWWSGIAKGRVSPIVLLMAVFVAAAAALSIGYWTTQAMSANEPDVTRQRGGLAKATGAVLIGAVAAAVLVGIVLAWRHDDAVVLGRGLGWLFGGGAALGLIGATVTFARAGELRRDGSLLTAQLRLWLTKVLAWTGKCALVLAILALIDTLGAGFVRWIDHAPRHLLSAGLFPALAFLIKKLPDWLGGTKGGGSAGAIGGLLTRFATTIALFAGLLLYGLLAIGASALVHHFAWAGSPWVSPPRWPSLIVLTGLAWILALLSGGATGFINLSSLHALYSARLIRAYLGASNVHRLELKGDARHPHPVTENHPCDYIQPRVYGETDLPAPIHIINVTLNETIDPTSQIVARDRKGDLLCLEPDGIRIGQDLLGWDRLANQPPLEGRSRAENVSLGQWCAISGAAASSAMGRMTNLGYAIAFTFANIRLGYWWWAPRVCPDMPPVAGWQALFARYFGTFVYLANEMTCRYSRGYDRKYLTDGGHYENSGAYALIRRRVPLILVSDNGADPGYAFEDLQTLVRQVRIDLGGETTILGDAELAGALDLLGATDRTIFVDPVRDPDWKRRMTDPAAAPFVLVLRVDLAGDRLHLLWIKPRLLPDLPSDISGYAALTGSFPQQPTGDQFFDEAQWESYRRLGEESINRLLAACPALLA